MTLVSTRLAAASAASARLRTAQARFRRGTAARWLARRSKTAQAKATGLPLGAGERVLILAHGLAGPLVAATAAAVYLNDHSEPGRSWRRVGWEEVIKSDWDDRRGILALTGAGPGGIWREELAVGRRSTLAELARERVSATVLASSTVWHRDRACAVVMARRQPGSGQVIWVTLVNQAGQADDQAVRAKATAAIAVLAAQTGIPAGLGARLTVNGRRASRCCRCMPYLPGRRGGYAMPVLAITVRIMRHMVNPGDKYGRLTVLSEVPKTAADGRRYRAALCRCDCGNETTPRISSLNSGDTQSCGCSRGRPKYLPQRCPVCGMPATIRRDRRSCSRACGYQLVRAARQAAKPSYAGWHRRVSKARGPASRHPCADCGQPAQDWSTDNPSSDDMWVRFQPRCRRCHRRHDGAVGEGSPRAKLTAQKVRELRARRADGLTYRQLAAEFGISDVSACAAVNRKTWTHVS